jgi:hypothetical protein
MWPFAARVNEKTAPIERIAAVAICRRLRGHKFAANYLAFVQLASIRLWLRANESTL